MTWRNQSCHFIKIDQATEHVWRIVCQSRGLRIKHRYPFNQDWLRVRHIYTTIGDARACVWNRKWSEPELTGNDRNRNWPEMIGTGTDRKWPEPEMIGTGTERKWSEPELTGTGNDRNRNWAEPDMTWTGSDRNGNRPEPEVMGTGNDRNRKWS